MAREIVQMWTSSAVGAIRRAARPGGATPHHAAGAGPDARYGGSAGPKRGRAPAATWYVAPGAAAAAPCGAARAHPCASINVAMGEAASGNTISIAAGTYTAATARNLVVVSKNLTRSE